MTIVFELSTDPDIVATPLAAGWPATTARYGWNQVAATNLGLPGGGTIVAIAHGNNEEIGNAEPGTIDIDAAIFLALIQGNLQPGQFPAAIYISACGQDIAGFAAGVRLLAEQNQIWAATRIYGHHAAVGGPVPPPTPGSLDWVQIF